MYEIKDIIDKVHCADCLEFLKQMPSDSIDCLVTDPPYGYSFMGKEWDRVVIPVPYWKECLRVLKPGAFAFVMSAPRQDVLSRAIVNLQDAGFVTGFTSIYWCYASGFPKAGNIGKMVDKRLGAERKVIGFSAYHCKGRKPYNKSQNIKFVTSEKDLSDDEKYLTVPASLQARALDGSYCGFQPKPAVEVILVAMKPLTENTYVDQALKNGKGVTWLDDGRVPYEGKNDHQIAHHQKTVNANMKMFKHDSGKKLCGDILQKYSDTQGRFPANLLVSDDALNDGRVSRSGQNCIRRQEGRFVEHKLGGKNMAQVSHNDSGSFSRYFSLDVWWEKRIAELPEAVQRTFPFIITPKASKREKNQGCEELEKRNNMRVNAPRMNEESKHITKLHNHHATVKPLALMSYLIIIGSRPDDIVLDPFVGSGTTCMAAKMLRRQYVGIEKEVEYVKIAEARLRNTTPNLL